MSQLFCLRFGGQKEGLFFCAGTLIIIIVAEPKFLQRPLHRSACFEAIEGKSSPKSMPLALGRDQSARPVLSYFLATRIFLLFEVENWQFGEPTKQSEHSKIVLMSTLGTSLLDVNALCKQQRSPVIFTMALCTEVNSLSRSCVYFQDLGEKMRLRMQ